MLARRSVPIEGSATFTTVVSNTITKNPTQAATSTAEAGPREAPVTGLDLDRETIMPCRYPARTSQILTL